MAILNNKEISQTFDYLSTLENILQKEIRLVNGNKSHLDKIVPERLQGEYSKKESTAFKFIDDLSKTSYDLSIIALIATFEKVIFAKYKTSFGAIKAIVGSNVPKQFDFYPMREKFVDGSIDKLSTIIKLIQGHIDNELFNDLKTIKDHRDYIAHGKRYGAPPPIEMKLEQIASTLDIVITEIEK